MRRFLAAKILLIVLIVSITPPQIEKAEAGIPVIDVASIVQAAIAAVEAVTQTAQLVEQYRTQLQQYENQLRNSLNPDTWVWDRAQQTMDNIRRTVDTLEHYKNTYQSLDRYLGQFKDLNYYKNNPCFNGQGCSEEQMRAVLDTRALASESSKNANDALFRGLDLQQQSMEADARQLERIQNGAQTAEGQMQAIQFANQLASNQANQLLQIRSLLATQHNASTAMLQAEVDRQAQEQAAGQNLRRSFFTPSNPIVW